MQAKLQDQLQNKNRIKNSTKMRHPINHLQSSKMLKTHQGPLAVSNKPMTPMKPTTMMDKSNSSSR